VTLGEVNINSATATAGNSVAAGVKGADINCGALTVMVDATSMPSPAR
jgi:hypothetical protein